MMKNGDKINDRMVMGELVAEDKGSLSPWTGFLVVRCGKHSVQIVRNRFGSGRASDVSAPMPKSSIRDCGSLNMGYREFRRYCPA
jgi:hypothetical protein